MKNSIYLCQSIIKISYQNMKQVRFEFEELPYDTLSQFGLTREMIEDLPMQTLEEISHGRHSPVLPIKVNDENGNTVTERSRFAFVRKENGEADVLFFPVLKKSPLEKYNEEQKKQLQSGKTILAYSVTADGRKTKVFVQIDTETNQVMSVPTQVIARNLQVLAEELKLSNAEIKVMQQGEPLTFVMEDEPVTVGIDLNEKNGIRFCQGDSRNGASRPKENGTNTPSAVTAVGSWTMTDVLTMYPKNSTPKNSGTNRKRVPNAMWAQDFTNNLQSL